MDRSPKALKRVKEPSPFTFSGIGVSTRSSKTEMRKRVLIIDQDPHSREMISRVLSLMGYEVMIARGGDEGLQIFSKLPCDLVLTELRLPGTDGWTLASRMKKEFPETPIILVTAEYERDILGRIEGSAVDIVMFRPFGFHDIQRTVREVLKN
jgi:DNA-binding response OmpR family regulator